MAKASQRGIPEGAPEGAPELHFESYVFDYSPLGEPIIMSPAMEEAMNTTLDSGKDATAALRAMVTTRNHEMRTDPAVHEQVRSVWRASGVNGVQITLGGTYMEHAFNSQIADIAHWNERCLAGGDMAICRTADELEAAKAEDKIGIVLGTQDCSIIDDLSKLDVMAGLGVKVIQLTFNTRNFLADGCTERNAAGLSKFGIEAVKRMNDLGILVDTSHSSFATSNDAIEFSEVPPVITHATCYEVAPHPRAKTDETLQALGEKEGYIGINLVPFFLVPGGGKANLDMLADHIEHAAKLSGVERVGVGTDWALWTPDFPARMKGGAHQKVVQKAGKFDKKDVPNFQDEDLTVVTGFEKWEYWSNITAKLLERFSPDEVKGLIGGNWLAYMRRAGS